VQGRDRPWLAAPLRRALPPNKTSGCLRNMGEGDATRRRAEDKRSASCNTTLDTIVRQQGDNSLLQTLIQLLLVASAAALFAVVLSLKEDVTALKRSQTPPSAVLPQHPVPSARPRLTALVLRGYNPTDSMLRRWALFARSCANSTGASPFHLSVSLDVTNRSRADDIGRLHDVLAEGASAHTYTEADLLRHFVGLKLLARKYENLTRRTYRIGRYAIVEPIVLWYWWARAGVLARHTLSHVWILEQDVAASRPSAIATMLAAYNDVKSDLITALPINNSRFILKSKHQGSTGLHAAVHTPAFAAAFTRPVEELRTASIFVQRWSPRLMVTLEEAMHQRSMHAWAEIAVPSLCRRAGLQMSTLRAEHRGALFHACCTKHVKTTSHNFLPDESKFNLRIDQSAVKLFHPVKF